MPGNRKRWRLNLAGTPTDLLVLFAREAGLASAQRELIKRCRRWNGRWVGQLAGAVALDAADRDDARQEALWWTETAVRDFDVKQLVKPAGCSFRSFLERRIRSRFRNSVRGLRRRSRRFRQLPEGELEQRLSASVASRAYEDTEARAELRDRVRRALAHLDDLTRALWAGLCADKTHAEIAAELGVSTKTIQRRWNELVAKVRQAVDGEPRR